MVAVAQPRVAIAGFQHETNSFSPVTAGIEAFVQPTNWPGMTRGAAIAETFFDLNIAIGGFVGEARSLGFDIEPIVWTNATPSGPVNRHAFETIADEIVDGIRGTEKLAAVYLDLHGAMIADGFADAEAELLRRIRSAIGNDVPIVVSLDLHANISQEMQSLSDALIVCRTYPHVDLAETGRRSARALAQILGARGQRDAIVKRLWKADFLIPTQSQTTFLDPAKSLYAQLPELERRHGLLDLSMAMGFGLSDTPAVGPAICATGFDATEAESAVAALARNFSDARSAFDHPVHGAREAIALARAFFPTGRPVILADLQDNPGAGGTGDTTGLLVALAEAGLERSVLAVLYDPAAAAAAHAAGEGATLRLSLGGHVGGPGSVPFDAEARVERLGSGRFIGTGPMYGGGPMYFGPMASLRLAQGSLVVVGSVNTQAADEAILQHLEIDPRRMEIVALKSGVHFRAAFEPLASKILVVREDGANPASYSELPYRNIRSGLQLTPVN